MFNQQQGYYQQISQPNQQQGYYQQPSPQVIRRDAIVTIKLIEGWCKILVDLSQKSANNLSKELSVLLSDDALNPKKALYALITSMYGHPIIRDITIIDNDTYTVDMYIRVNDSSFGDLLMAFGRDKYLSAILLSAEVNTNMNNPTHDFFEGDKLVFGGRSSGFSREESYFKHEKPFADVEELKNMVKRELITVWKVSTESEMMQSDNKDFIYSKFLNLNKRISIVYGRVEAYYTIVNQLTSSLVQMDTIKIAVSEDRGILANELVSRAILPNTTIVIDKETKAITLETIA